MVEVLDRGFRIPTGATPTSGPGKPVHLDDLYLSTPEQGTKEISQRCAPLGADLLEGASVLDYPHGQGELLTGPGLHDKGQNPASGIVTLLVDRVDRDHKPLWVDVQAPPGALRVDRQVAKRDRIRVGDEALDERRSHRIFIECFPGRLLAVAESVNGVNQPLLQRHARDRNRQIRQGPKAPMVEGASVLLDRRLRRNMDESKLSMTVCYKNYEVLAIKVGASCGGSLACLDRSSQAQGGCKDAEVQGIHLPRKLPQTLPLSAALRSKEFYPTVSQTIVTSK